MIKASSIFLRNEITAHDTKKLAEWLEDGEVKRYLNEKKNVSVSLRQFSAYDFPSFTYHFNQGGRFFMVCKNHDSPIGFVRLVPNNKENEHEIVIVIGDRKIWGHGYGTHALHKSLKLAFFQWRTRKVIANIHNENTRSVRIFTKAGFRVEKELPNMKRYCVTLEDYLKSELKKSIS